MKRLCCLILLLFVSGGCSRPPQAELAAARDALARAYAAGASRLASDDYLIAKRALQDSEALVHDGDYRAARELLPFATLRARRALVLAHSADEQLRRAELERRERAIAAARQRQLQQQPPPPPPSKPDRTAPRKPVPPPQLSYTVGEGESLYSIAAQPQVYDDPLLWPLLYKANRDQIRDPRQIYSGQVLTIPRELSSAELDDARQKAKQSDVFPPGGPISAPESKSSR
ncbi:LysM peptidoglycan-binding domain-containing protein [Desulfuromonas carbonis]